MQRYLSQLTKSHNELLLNIRTKDARVDELVVENMSLRDRISKLTSESQKLQWELHHQNKSTKKLLIGSSIIRDIDSAKLVNTDVRSIGGAKVKTVKDELENMNSQLDELIVVVGGNDCDEESREAGSVHDILETYDSLIEIAKTKADSITVSSICPRNTAVKTQTSIDALNAGLQDLCATKGCEYVDQRGSFTLGDGSINDGYILSDGVHLNRSGANRLAKNLKLKVKDNVKDITKPRKHDKAKPKPGNRDNSPHDLGATRHGGPHGERHSPGIARRPGNPGNFGRELHAKDTRPRTADFPAPRDPRYNRDMTGHHDANSNARPTYACFNCGETNHNRDTCRWDTPVTCFYCKQRGHKQKHCPYLSDMSH